MNVPCRITGQSIAIACGLFALAFLSQSSPARAAVIYVKAGAAGANNGASWTDAFTEIQSALSAAQAYDEIWVAAGTYKPTSGADRTVSFVLKERVGLYGGFAGNETARAQRNWTANATILSGDIGASGDISDNSYHVVVGRTEGVLDGFIITYGNANGTGINAYGGGMYNRVVYPTIINCSFVGNSAAEDGGGMYISYANPTVKDCSFTGNAAGGSGGGIDIFSNPEMTVIHCDFTDNSASSGGGMGGYIIATNCTFTGNTAPEGGGGLAAHGAINCTFWKNSGGSAAGFSCGGDGSATDCDFLENEATGSGGGMSGGTAKSCTFLGNTAGEKGGGLYLTYAVSCLLVGNKAKYGGGIYLAATTSAVYSAVAALTNCTITSCSASIAGGGMYFNDIWAPANIMNCIFWDDSAPQGAEIYKFSGMPAYIHCDIQRSGGSGGLVWNSSLGSDGGGNIDGDPGFWDATHPAGPDGAWRTADDGLHLLDGSPCINAGRATGAPATDILGLNRRGPPDIGAYESFYLSAAMDWMLYR